MERSAGRLDEAQAYYQRAVEVMEEALGPEHVHVSHPLLGLGRVARARGEPRRAIEPLERSVALREAAGVDPAEIGESRFELAQALWDGPGERERARALAGRALADYQAAEREEPVAEIEAWLRGHPG